MYLLIKLSWTTARYHPRPRGLGVWRFPGGKKVSGVSPFRHDEYEDLCLAKDVWRRYPVFMAMNCDYLLPGMYNTYVFIERNFFLKEIS